MRNAGALRRCACLAFVVTLATSAIADVAVADPAESLAPQIEVDGGLSVIGPAYEHPVASHIAIGVEAFIFGTYFLPWFDAGQDVKGFGGGIRPTWFRNANGRGLYVAPYLRVVAVDDESITGATDVGWWEPVRGKLGGGEPVRGKLEARK